MVHESSPGDIITLGTSSWRIRQITGDRVVVDPAEGRSARLPFWKGEGLGRPAATGLAKGVFLREVQSSLPSETGAGESEGERALRRRLTEAGLDAHARSNLLALLREQYRATSALPTDETLVLERYEDESGSWRIIVHSTLGRCVHEPWAMAIRERVHQLLGVRPQTIVADDGIVLQIPPVEGGLPGAGLITFDAAEISSLVRSRIETTALFAARFRECAARALLMPAARPGRRTPLWLQRVKAGQLLEASRQFRDFPVSVEAARECLQQYYDLPALTDLMERLISGRVRVVEAVTSEPSPFAHPLLFGYASTLIYQEDLPHAERRAQLLSLDPKALAALLGDGGVAELLDDEVLAQVEAELQHLAPGRRVRADAEGIAVDHPDLRRLLERYPLSALRAMGAQMTARDAGLATTATALAAWHARSAYCPACGGRTEIIEAGWARRCSDCATVHFPRTDPAVIMTVVDASDRLLLVRGATWAPRRYSVVAGFVEAGESVEAAVAREVREETGLHVAEVDYVASQPWPFPRSLMLGCRARLASGEDLPRPDGHEVVEARLVPRDELMAGAADGSILLPGPTSIARLLIEDWYGGPIAG